MVLMTWFPGATRKNLAAHCPSPFCYILCSLTLSLTHTHKNTHALTFFWPLSHSLQLSVSVSPHLISTLPPLTCSLIKEAQLCCSARRTHTCVAYASLLSSLEDEQHCAKKHCFVPHHTTQLSTPLGSVWLGSAALAGQAREK